MDKLRIGVIGYGYWGPNLVRNFVEIPGAEMIAVSDLRIERLAQVERVTLHQGQLHQHEPRSQRRKVGQRAPPGPRRRRSPS